MSRRASEAARDAGISRETLRYYERRGLIEQPDRSPGGHRLYDDDAVRLLQSIKAAQRLGFTLAEVRDLLEVVRRPGRNPSLHARAQAKLAEVEDRMADLAAVRDNLRRVLADGCDDLQACAHNDGCPVPTRSVR